MRWKVGASSSPPNSLPLQSLWMTCLAFRKQEAGLFHARTGLSILPLQISLRTSMNNIDISPDDNLLALTSRIVAAYVSHNALSATDLVTLISSTHSALNGLGRPAPEPVLPLTPAV